MLIKNLGPNYVVWDKEATIRFLKPDRSHVTAEFHLTEEDLAHIRTTVEEEGRLLWMRTILIKDTHNDPIAEVTKTISIKKKIS